MYDFSKYSFAFDAGNGRETDRRHVEMLYKILCAYPFKKVLEIGCFTGASTSAFVEALNHSCEFELHLCDVAFVPTLYQVTKHCLHPEKIYYHEKPSLKVIDNSFDLIFVDGNHRIKYVTREAGLILYSRTPNVILHDSTNPAVFCSGSRFFAEVLRAHPMFQVLEDSKQRKNEATHRGFLFASQDPDTFAAIEQMLG